MTVKYTNTFPSHHYNLLTYNELHANSFFAIYISMLRLPKSGACVLIIGLIHELIYVGTINRCPISDFIAVFRL